MFLSCQPPWDFRGFLFHIDSKGLPACPVCQGLCSTPGLSHFSAGFPWEQNRTRVYSFTHSLVCSFIHSFMILPVQMVMGRGYACKRRYKILCTNNKGKQAHIGKNPTKIGLCDQAQLKKGVRCQQMGTWKSELGTPFLKPGEDPGGA